MRHRRKKLFAAAGLVAIAAVMIGVVFAFQPRPLRRHTANRRGTLRLVPATETVAGESPVTIRKTDGWREIRVNGLPDHKVGPFPNRGNPHTIREQRKVYRVPLQPEVLERPMPVGLSVFGISVNGIPFDPGAAEFWRGEPRLGWNYEAMSAAVPLGLDENHAHVQPNGAYHYHGLPTALLEKLGVDGSGHSPLVGWAADGFPIYALYGYEDPQDASSAVRKLRSSYRLKKGQRPGGQRGPGGTYDGTFLADYENVDGAGDLDECNGRQTVTPDFPDGTYAYFLSEAWPVIPRNYRGKPSEAFRRRPPRAKR